MSKLVTIVFVALLLGSAALGTMTALHADEPAGAAARWEYRAIVPREGGTGGPGVEPVPARAFFESIQRAGAEGWELTAFDPTGGAWMRRPLR